MPSVSRIIRLLIGCDSVDTSLEIVKYLSDSKQAVHYMRVDSASAIKAALEESWDIFVCDLHMENFSNHEVFETLHDLSLNIPLVLLCRPGERDVISVKALAVGAIEVFEIDQLGSIPPCIFDALEHASRTTSYGDEKLSWDDFPSGLLLVDSHWQIRDSNSNAKHIAGNLAGRFFDIWQEDSRVFLEQRCRSFAVGEGSEEVVGSVAEPLKLKANNGFYRVHLQRVKRGDALQYSAMLQDISDDVALNTQRQDDLQNLKQQYRDTLSRFNETQKRDTNTLLAKTQFLSQIGHEIRTPMNAISGFAEALNRRALDPDSKVLANRISRASSMLLSVVNDLLDFSKIEANQLQILRDPFFLNDVLDDLAFIMIGSAKAKQLELSIVSPEQQFTYLEGDDLRLKQILINLTANAIKFTEVGSVSLAVEVIKREAGQITYKFSVKDTGIGMDSEQITKIMEPFAQASMDISRRYGGTGLGLSICRSLIEKMGGELMVKSQPAKGSTFYFTLSFPLLTYPTSKLQKMADVTVLIADDNPIALQGLDATVASMNWQPKTFASGSDLLTSLQQHPEWQGPHCLVLLDWKMPDIDGFEVAERISDILPPEKRPIIFMITSRESAQLLDSDNSRFVDRILDKPLSTGALYDAVLSVMKDRFDMENNDEQRLANFNILVVEDSDLNAELVKTILDEEGANVEVMMTGKEALNQLLEKDCNADIVLLDLQLPDIDGFEVATTIRETFASEALPIIAMTARESAEDRLHARRVGMDDWIAKPLNRERLVLLIQQYCLQNTRPKIPEEVGGDPDASARFIRLRWERLPLINSKSSNVVTHVRDVYLKLLQKFINNYMKPMQALEAGNLDDNEVAKLAHKLRGGSLSLGLERLSELCLVFEESMSNSVKYRPSNEELALVLRQSVDVVLPMLEDTSAQVGPLQNNSEVDVASLRACLLEGIDLLKTYNLEQVNPFLKQLQTLGMEQLLQDINHQLDDFDFSGAVRIARHKVKTLSEPLDRGQ